jgi:transcriptional regulator GlxA family with amidase domain
MAAFVAFLALQTRATAARMGAMPPRRVVIVAFPGVQSLDVCGPLEVFTGASRWLCSEGRTDPGYRVTVASRGGVTLRTSSGLQVAPDADLDAVRGPLDTLLVAGGEGTRAAASDAELVRRIGGLARTSRRVASVCTGAFLLAAAGLLEGRRATTHWSACEALARHHPEVLVDPDPIFVRDGNVFTSAGVTAGIDLSLALVEDDVGHEVALTVARWLVLFLRRPGTQAQFSAHLATQTAQRDSLRELQRWIASNPQDDLRVEALAARTAMSPRHFARTFHEEVGTTPARYVERVRLEAARWRLEDTDATAESIATDCGFGTAETMRRGFLRALGTSPAEYRRRFRSAATLGA